jgi:signal peptidase I
LKKEINRAQSLIFDIIMKKKNILKELLSYVIIIILVIAIRTFLVTPVQVHQESMNPTLYPGYIMLLNKIGYTLNGVGRFDLVVINYENEHIIKRVIGLPGEKIEYKEYKLLVNDKEVKEYFLETTTADFTLDSIGYSVIPDNKYFVLGDNRNNSTDSRIIGLIDKSDILGKTSFILYPFNKFGSVK